MLEADEPFIARAVELAVRGRGHVEPNPMVGAVLVRDGQVVGEGWHQQFGGPHAEVMALNAAGESSRGATLYVSLEPCCHQGKTPPCTDAVINAHVLRVVVGCQDPNPEMSGQGIDQLREAGIEVEVLDAPAAKQLIAPFAKLMTQGEPWIIAKWAMTLDGKIATHTGASQWISSEESRQIVHEIRGRVDAILVGRITVERDNPLLTARPAGSRIATRIVLDSDATISLESQLVQTASEYPLMIVARETAPAESIRVLKNQGVEVFQVPAVAWQEQLGLLLRELGSRRMTNILVEGGSQVLGAFLEIDAIDEVHAFVAPKLAGGNMALSPIGGKGLAEMNAALPLQNVTINAIGNNAHIHGFVDRSGALR